MTLRLAFGPLRLVASAALVALAGCASESTVRQYVPQIVTPYRIDIQQGNFITQDMLDKLAVGQTREQVRFIMGTPLVTDMFHATRWDYVFRASKGWRDPEARRLVIHFDANGKVARWETEGAPPPRETSAPAPAAPAAEKPAPATEKPAVPGSSVPTPTPSADTTPAVPGVAAATPAPAPVVPPPAPATDAPVPAPPVPVAASSAGTAVVPAPAAGVMAPTAPAASAPATAASSPAPTTPVVPAPAAAQPAADLSPTRVLAALESWRAAWTARDVERYLSMYAADFQVPAGLTRARWEAQRRERIRKPSFIVVKVVDPQVSIAGDAAATAVFTQVYESDSLKESGRKTLALVRQGSDWKIRDERFEK